MKIEVAVIIAPQKGKVVTEDTFIVLKKDHGSFFAVVVDGHGPGGEFNAQTAEFARYVAYGLSSLFRRESAIHSWTSYFDIVQKDVEGAYGDLPFGAVATCVHVGAFGLTIAQAGDCRLYRFDPENPYGYELLTQDHCVENKQEMQRLRPFYQSGDFAPISHGSMNWMSGSSEERLHFKTAEGTWSAVSLSPTRGFGDPDFRPAFTHVPEIRMVNFPIDKQPVFALCSDGGVRVVQDVFKYARTHDPVMDQGFLTRLESTAKMMVPKNLKDDLTIIFFRILPTL